MEEEANTEGPDGRGTGSDTEGEPSDGGDSSLHDSESVEEVPTPVVEPVKTESQDGDVADDMRAGDGIWAGRLRKRPKIKDTRGRGP